MKITCPCGASIETFVVDNIIVQSQVSDFQERHAKCIKPIRLGDVLTLCDLAVKAYGGKSYSPKPGVEPIFTVEDVVARQKKMQWRLHKDCMGQTTRWELNGYVSALSWVINCMATGSSE